MVSIHQVVDGQRGSLYDRNYLLVPFPSIGKGLKDNLIFTIYFVLGSDGHFVCGSVASLYQL
jgi:hypothetical protein